MAFVLGLNHKIYVQTTGPRAAWPGTGAAPALEEITLAMDVTFTGDAATADASTRGGGSFRQSVATLKDAEVEFEAVFDTADTAVIALKDAWIANTVIGIAILNGDSATAANEGIWMDAMVTGMEWNQELEEVGKIQFTLKNALSNVALEWITVG